MEGLCVMVEDAWNWVERPKGTLPVALASATLLSAEEAHRRTSEENEELRNEQVITRKDTEHALGSHLRHSPVVHLRTHNDRYPAEVGSRQVYEEGPTTSRIVVPSTR